VPRESFPLEEARVLKQDPEVIVLCWCGTLQRKQNPSKVYAREGWRGLQAVVGKRVFAVDEGLFGRPGPRLVDGTEALAKILHPGAAV
jgi:iron complex transport system substrate-binding protein